MNYPSKQFCRCTSLTPFQNKVDDWEQRLSQFRLIMQQRQTALYLSQLRAKNALPKHETHHIRSSVRAEQDKLEDTFKLARRAENSLRKYISLRISLNDMETDLLQIEFGDCIKMAADFKHESRNLAQQLKSGGGNLPRVVTVQSDLYSDAVAPVNATPAGGDSVFSIIVLLRLVQLILGKNKTKKSETAVN